MEYNYGLLSSCRGIFSAHFDVLPMMVSDTIQKLYTFYPRYTSEKIYVFSISRIILVYMKQYMQVCMYGCMYICLHVYIYVCMYECMYRKVMRNGQAQGLP